MGAKIWAVATAVAEYRPNENTIASSTDWSQLNLVNIEMICGFCQKYKNANPNTILVFLFCENEISKYFEYVPSKRPGPGLGGFSRIGTGIRLFVGAAEL